MEHKVDVRANIALLGRQTSVKPFTAILSDVQEYISRNYAEAIQYDGADNQALVKAYIAKYPNDLALIHI